MTEKMRPGSAQMATERLVPKLEPAMLVSPVRLEDVPTTATQVQIRKATCRISRAAIDGHCTLDEARKAMNLKKTHW